MIEDFAKAEIILHIVVPLDKLICQELTPLEDHTNVVISRPRA